MAADLDDFDSRILDALRRDGRAPVSQVADQIGLSRPAVAERIEKLTAAGVIRGTTVVVDPALVGKPVTAFIAARGPRLVGKTWAAFRELLAHEEVLEVHTVAGDDCFLIKIRTESIRSLTELVNRLTSAPLSLSTRTTIVLETHCEKVGGINLGVEETR